MKIEWAEYLKRNPESDWVLTNDDYKAAWEEVLQKNINQLPSGELGILIGNITIQNRSMILDYLLVNRSNHPVKDIEIGLSLSVLGKEYFNGRIKTKENWYDELLPENARLDFIDFGNDRFEDQLLTPKDYTLTVHFCKEIEYLEKENMETVT